MSEAIENTLNNYIIKLEENGFVMQTNKSGCKVVGNFLLTIMLHNIYGSIRVESFIDRRGISISLVWNKYYYGDFMDCSQIDGAIKEIAQVVGLIQRIEKLTGLVSDIYLQSEKGIANVSVFRCVKCGEEFAYIAPAHPSIKIGGINYLFDELDTMDNKKLSSLINTKHNCIKDE